MVIQMCIPDPDSANDAEEDSDYKSDFDSEEEDSNDIFDKIAKYLIIFFNDQLHNKLYIF